MPGGKPHKLGPRLKRGLGMQPLDQPIKESVDPDIHHHNAEDDYSSPLDYFTNNHFSRSFNSLILEDITQANVEEHLNLHLQSKPQDHLDGVDEEVQLNATPLKHKFSLFQVQQLSNPYLDYNRKRKRFSLNKSPPFNLKEDLLYDDSIDTCLESDSGSGEPVLRQSGEKDELPRGIDNGNDDYSENDLPTLLIIKPKKMQKNAHSNDDEDNEDDNDSDMDDDEDINERFESIQENDNLSEGSVALARVGPPSTIRRSSKFLNLSIESDLKRMNKDIDPISDLNEIDLLSSSSRTTTPCMNKFKRPHTLVSQSPSPSPQLEKPDKSSSSSLFKFFRESPTGRTSHSHTPLHTSHSRTKLNPMDSKKQIRHNVISGIVHPRDKSVPSSVDNWSSLSTPKLSIKKLKRTTYSPFNKSSSPVPAFNFYDLDEDSPSKTRKASSIVVFHDNQSKGMQPRSSLERDNFQSSPKSQTVTIDSNFRFPRSELVRNLFQSNGGIGLSIPNKSSETVDSKSEYEFDDKENKSYKFVKPLQMAFKSTGLIKKNSLSKESRKLPPETPMKKNPLVLINTNIQLVALKNAQAIPASTAISNDVQPMDTEFDEHDLEMSIEFGRNHSTNTSNQETSYFGIANRSSHLLLSSTQEHSGVDLNLDLDLSIPETPTKKVIHQQQSQFVQKQPRLDEPAENSIPATVDAGSSIEQGDITGANSSSSVPTVTTVCFLSTDKLDSHAKYGKPLKLSAIATVKKSRLNPVNLPSSITTNTPRLVGTSSGISSYPGSSKNSMHSQQDAKFYYDEPCTPTNLFATKSVSGTTSVSLRSTHTAQLHSSKYVPTTDRKTEENKLAELDTTEPKDLFDSSMIVDNVDEADDLTITQMLNANLSRIDDHLVKKFGMKNIKFIGNGEFSIAYECQFQDQKYAIKRTKKPVIGKLERKATLREIDALRALTNVGDIDENDIDDDKNAGRENLLYFIEAWEFNNYFYIMTEFCDNGTLYEFLEENKHYKIDEFRIWKILIEILNGVLFIHLKNYLHLDLKPANIFITFEGSLKIGDFGLATKLPILEKDFDLEGDRSYIAPELINDKIYTPFADIFSVGLIVLETAANIILPENGTPWRKLRSGDLSDAGKLSSDNISDILNRNSSSITSYDSIEHQSSPKEDTNTTIEVENVTVSPRPQTQTRHQLFQAISGGTLRPHIRSSNNRSGCLFNDDAMSLDKLVSKMLKPNPFDRPTANMILEMPECVMVENRRKAGATIFEGEFGPE